MARGQVSLSYRDVLHRRPPPSAGSALPASSMLHSALEPASAELSGLPDAVFWYVFGRAVRQGRDISQLGGRQTEDLQVLGSIPGHSSFLLPWNCENLGGMISGFLK